MPLRNFGRDRSKAHRAKAGKPPAIGEPIPLSPGIEFLALKTAIGPGIDGHLPAAGTGSYDRLPVSLAFLFLLQKRRRRKPKSGSAGKSTMTPDEIKKKHQDMFNTEMFFREEAEMATDTHTHIDPALLHEAKHSPVLAAMIKEGLPLNRQTWIDLNWGSEVPKPWTAEDEAQIPLPWREHNV